MRRYRKGQYWRPPSAAESSAHADAAGAHQRKPTQPQDLAPIGQSILVKTPDNGIPARDGDMIYWAMCKRCIQRNTPDGKEIVETDEAIVAYNLLESDQPGGCYVATALTECGTRYVLPRQPTRLAWYQLLDDNDGETYASKGNPGVFSTETGFLYDEHWSEPTPDNPDWTVLLVDGTRQMPCWRGDWVQAEDVPYTLPEPYDNYRIKMITNRASAQMDFMGMLGQFPLFHMNKTTAWLYINGRWVEKEVWDFGLLTLGQSLPKYTTIDARYYLETRRFYVVHAPCGVPFT